MGEIVKLFPGKDAQHPPTPEGGYMDAGSFRTDIIRPALKVTGLWSLAAENLMLGTALAESNLMYVKQFKAGCALSFFQLEPKTYIDVVRYLNLRQRELKDRILSACYLEMFPEPDALIWNLKLSTLIARALYWMEPTPLPDANDVIGMGKYYVKYYHRSDTATPEKYAKAWEAYA